MRTAILVSLERNLRFSTKRFFARLSARCEQPFNSTAIFTSLAFLAIRAVLEEEDGKRERNNMWRFYKLFSLFILLSLNLVKLTRGVYQAHNLKFGAFCRLWLAGRKDERTLVRPKIKFISVKTNINTLIFRICRGIIIKFKAQSSA